MIATHAGDLGDLIYFLPCLKAWGGGHLRLWSKPYVRSPFTPTSVERIASFLASQPYVHSVQYDNTAIPDRNGDDFRATWQRRRVARLPQLNIAELHLIAFGLDPNIANEKWLEIEPATGGPAVLFNRSFRYRNPRIDWKTAFETYKSIAAFVGTREEHTEFCGNVGRVPYIETPTLLELARLVAGAKLVVCNQSAAGAISIGMKQRTVLEVWDREPNCIFPGVLNAWDNTFKWPDI